MVKMQCFFAEWGGVEDGYSAIFHYFHTLVQILQNACRNITTPLQIPVMPCANFSDAVG